jgi:hypothetical protein
MNTIIQIQRTKKAGNPEINKPEITAARCSAQKRNQEAAACTVLALAPAEHEACEWGSCVFNFGRLIILLPKSGVACFAFCSQLKRI